MRITENRLRQIIRRVLVESAGDQAMIIVNNLKRHGLISQLMMMPGTLGGMVYQGMVQEIINRELDSVLGNPETLQGADLDNYYATKEQVEAELLKL